MIELGTQDYRRVTLSLALLIHRVLQSIPVPANASLYG
ncbi:hypothetical protein JCM19236_2959 [Vibrio sp. JCM 19236]|nr:hypothetical protein JCM19236_2959 [Vibrio sp. JCM 19236]